MYLIDPTIAANSYTFKIIYSEVYRDLLAGNYYAQSVQVLLNYVDDCSIHGTIFNLPLISDMETSVLRSVSEGNDLEQVI